MFADQVLVGVTSDRWSTPRACLNGDRDNGWRRGTSGMSNGKKRETRKAQSDVVNKLRLACAQHAHRRLLSTPFWVVFSTLYNSRCRLSSNFRRIAELLETSNRM